MKKVHFLLVIIASLVLCGLTVRAEQNADGEWELKYSVDEFGDITDDSETYLVSIVDGSFSNIATNDSDLLVAVFYNPMYNSGLYGTEMQFRLFEYGDTRATYYEDSKKNIMVKINDEIYQTYLTGFAPNGDVKLACFRNKAKLDNDTYSRVIQSLYDGNDVRCIITIDNSKYSFTIKASNFHDLFDTIQTEIHQRGDELFETEEYYTALVVYHHLYDNEVYKEVIQKRADELSDLGKKDEAAEYYEAIGADEKKEE